MLTFLLDDGLSCTCALHVCIGFNAATCPLVHRYGTSIVNGHVASRPGMIFTTVLGRKLARGVINLGFGGNGEMERSVIKVMSQLKQAALVVIDCNWNMDPDHIRHNATSVVAQLRAEWSATKPIVMAGRISP